METAKKIRILAFAAAGLGLLSEFTALFSFAPVTGTLRLVHTVRFLSPNIDLLFIRSSSLLSYYNFETSQRLNYLNLALYILVLVGAVLYYRSRGNETRLLRFTFSAIFLYHAAGLFLFLRALAFGELFLFQYPDYAWMDAVFNLVGIVFWCLASWFVVARLSAAKKLDHIQVTDDDGVKEVYTEASKGLRFVHLLIDSFFSIFILSHFIVFTGRDMLGRIESNFGEQIALYAFIFLARLIYYPVYETLFGATPAKLLTESRVISRENKKVSFKTSLGRTLGRFVPFEPFSYLGTGNGWHDTWADTRVVREKQTGVPGRKYLWLIPFFAGLAVTSYVGHEVYDNYRSYRWSREHHEQKIAAIEGHLATLADDCLIKLANTQSSYESDRIYLKVEAIKTESVTMTVIPVEEDYRYTQFDVEKLYLTSKDGFKKIDVSTASLRAAYTKDYDDYNDGARNGFDFLHDGRQFEIEQIDRIFGPAVKDRGTGGMSTRDGVSSLWLEMCNYGWPAEIVEINNLAGDIAWTNVLPQKIETCSYNDFPSFSFSGENYKSGVPYRFTFVLLDVTGNKQTYLVEGLNTTRTVKRLIDGF